MTFYSVTPVSSFIDDPSISTFHYDMFHGLAERDGKETPHDTHVFANTEFPSPLMLSRTGRRVPDICQPSSHLVVNEGYMRLLRDLPNVRLMPVVFKRLVDIEYRKGDMSWKEQWGNTDPRHLLRTLPDVPTLHETIGRFFEIQCFRWRDAADMHPEAPEVTICVGTPGLEERCIIRLSCKMLDEFPILCGGAIVMNERAFTLLENGLDPDFFVIRQYSLPSCQAAENR